jgi:hypothetical protein
VEPGNDARRLAWLPHAAVNHFNNLHRPKPIAANAGERRSARGICCTCPAAFGRRTGSRVGEFTSAPVTLAFVSAPTLDSVARSAPCAAAAAVRLILFHGRRLRVHQKGRGCCRGQVIATRMSGLHMARRPPYEARHVEPPPRFSAPLRPLRLVFVRGSGPTRRARGNRHRPEDTNAGRSTARQGQYPTPVNDLQAQTGPRCARSVRGISVLAIRPRGLFAGSAARR